MSESICRFDECKYFNAHYTYIDIWGHDDYEIYCSLKGKIVNYDYCVEKCVEGKEVEHEQDPVND